MWYLRKISCQMVAVVLWLVCVWMPAIAHADGSINLSAAEREWLAAHPVVRLGIDPNYAPYSFVDTQGNLQGVVADFLPHLEKLLGIRFEISADRNWPELMDAVRNKQIDAVATVVRLPERETFLAFSGIYLPTPLVVMTRGEQPQLKTLDELSKLSLVLVEGYSSSQQVVKLYPRLRPNYVARPLAGLQAVASGEADAYIGALGVNTFLAIRHGIANLKVNAAFDMEINGQRFGVRKDWGPLPLLLDKALAAIPANQQRVIFEKWLPVQVSDLYRLQGTSLVARLFPWLLGFSCLVAAAYLTLLLWNRQLKRELDRRRNELERAQAVVHMGDWSMDVASGQIEWSDELFRIAGRLPQVLDWPTLRTWVHPELRSGHDEYLGRLANLSPVEHLPPLMSHLLWPDGTARWLEISCAAEFDKTGKPVRLYGTALDVTERKESEDKIRHLAFFDPLTHLPNRRLLKDRLGQAMAASTRSHEYGALLMLDLDHFKDINDTQGHAAGDQLLVDVAKRLVANVRLEDTVSRLGGDEYVVVAEGLGESEASAALQAETIAEKVRTALARPYQLAGNPAYFCSASIGVTLFCGQGTDDEVLFKQADVALYQAKRSGRNTTRFFNPDMQARIDSRIKMENALRYSLQQGELHLYYQPQVDVDGRLIGAEALLRWLPTGAAPVSPAQFIPLAEETGLILSIGDWVLETACAQILRWEKNVQTRSLTVAVNVSARQFHQECFVERLLDLVQRSGINPSRLKLELTESVVLERSEMVIAHMQQLKAHGIGFSLDDFGTGYSSLAYLKRLPLDQVKIDQSFVRDIAHDPNDAAIVSAILAMCRSLGLQVIAEGVETEAQRQLLGEYGCVYFQGYLFGRPLPAEDWPDKG